MSQNTFTPVVQEKEDTNRGHIESSQPQRSRRKADDGKSGLLAATEENLVKSRVRGADSEEGKTVGKTELPQIIILVFRDERNGKWSENNPG